LSPTARSTTWRLRAEGALIGGRTGQQRDGIEAIPVTHLERREPRDVDRLSPAQLAVDVEPGVGSCVDGQRYDVRVVGADGTPHSAGAFLGTGGSPVTCSLNAGVLRQDAVQFLVKDMRGTVVLSSGFRT